MPDRARAVVFDDFSGGEFGALGSWRAPRGSFTGQNVVRYVDGSLGPRNGLKALTVTGLPASALGSHIGIDVNGNLWFQVGTLVKTIDATYTGSQSATAIGDATYVVGQAVLVGSYVYAVNGSSGIKRFDFTTPAVTTVGSSPEGELIVQYGERTLVSGDISQPQRIYYSAAGNPESWPGSNFIDVGTGNTVKAMIPLRGGVAIYTLGNPYAGLDGRWWVLTGVPGVNDTLREVLTATQGPESDLDIALPGDGTVLFAAAKSESIGLFNGSTVSLIRHLSLGTPSVVDYRAVVGLREESDALVFAYTAASASSGVGYMRRDRGWFKQTFAEADVKQVLTTRDGTLPSDVAPVSRAQNLVIFATGASPPVFYIWSAYNDRPPFSGDYSASILTPSSVHFTLPDIVANAGEQISVRKITAWFRDWETGGSDNQFSINVTPIREYEADDGTTQTEWFSRANGQSTTTGVNLRREWMFAQSYGDGVSIKVGDMSGVAIQRIEVDLDVKADAV